MESAVTHRDLLTDYAIDKDIKYNEVHYQESWKGALGILTKADRVKSQVVLAVESVMSPTIMQPLYTNHTIFNNTIGLYLE